MPPAKRLDNQNLAKRVAQEFRPGDVVALGPGLPSLIPGELPLESEIQFLSDSGALAYRSNASPAPARSHLVDSSGQYISLLPGGSVSSLVDVAAMLRGGHVNIAVIQPAQVSAAGDFTHWTTAGTPGLFAPGTAVDLAAGARQVIAMMPHTDATGSPNVLNECSFLTDGAG